MKANRLRDLRLSTFGCSFRLRMRKRLLSCKISSVRRKRGTACAAKCRVSDLVPSVSGGIAGYSCVLHPFSSTWFFSRTSSLLGCSVGFREEAFLERMGEATPARALLTRLSHNSYLQCLFTRVHFQGYSLRLKKII